MNLKYLVASSISQEHRYSFENEMIFLTRYLTGLPTHSLNAVESVLHDEEHWLY